MVEPTLTTIQRLHHTLYKQNPDFSISLQPSAPKIWRESTIADLPKAPSFPSRSPPPDAMNNGKRRAPAAPSPMNPPKKAHPQEEEDEMDEDVYLDETLVRVHDEEEMILRDSQVFESLAACLSRWKRPPLSQAYLSHSQAVGEFRTSLWIVGFFLSLIEFDYIMMLLLLLLLFSFPAAGN